MNRGFVGRDRAAYLHTEITSCLKLIEELARVLGSGSSRRVTSPTDGPVDNPPVGGAA